MWTDQWDSGEVDHVIVMIMHDEDSMSEACHRQSLVPELNGPQLGTRFLPLLSKCVTNSPVHPLIKCCWQAQWCPAYQEQLGVQGLKNTSTQVDQTAILGIRGRPLYLLQRRLVFRITKAFFLRLLEDDLVDVHIRHLLFSCSQLDYFHCWDAETVSSWAFSLP